MELMVLKVIRRPAQMHIVLTFSQLELKRLVSIFAGVKLGAIQQRASIVHSNLAAKVGGIGAFALLDNTLENSAVAICRDIDSLIDSHDYLQCSGNNGYDGNEFEILNELQ